MNDGAVARDALGMLTSKKPDEIDERVDAAAEEFKAKKSGAMIVQRDHGLLFAFGSPPMSHLLANCRDPRTTGGRVTLVIRIPAAERLTDGCLRCLSPAYYRWPTCNYFRKFGANFRKFNRKFVSVTTITLMKLVIPILFITLCG